MTVRLLAVLIFLCFSLTLSAQNFFGFSKRINYYPQDIRTLFGTKLSEEDEKLVSEFIIDWKANVYDSLEKQKIVDISIKLYEHRGRTSQFKNLLTILTIFKLNETQSHKENYSVWMEYMYEYLSNTKISINTLSIFLDNIVSLLNDNTIHKTSTIAWKSTNANYKFQNNCPYFCINFPTGTLICYAKRDSIKIYGTTGVYNPMEKIWTGSGGIVTWERAGYDPKEVNARLKGYHINMTRTEYTADSVEFTYPKYFKAPVLGQLEEQVMNISSPESAAYPIFNSFGKRFVFKDLYTNLDYDGGFSMRGAKIVGAGSESEDAKITIKKDNKPLMEVNSKFFVFRPTRVNGINTKIKIILERDSIYHSNLSFVYHAEEQEVSLIKSDNYASQSPYYDSYHKLNMDFGQLNWRINQPLINLTMPKAAAIGSAKFESESFFNQSGFEEIQGRDFMHPLIALRRFSRSIGSDQFRASLYSDYVGRSTNEVNQVLMEMTKKGYIYYNDQTDMVTIRQKLINCLKYAAGSSDFDVVNFNSQTQAPLDNATLNMDNYDLVINGVPRIAVSDSQNVIIYPAREQIIMKSNRSFQFDGKVTAGLFTVFGSNFFFDYNTFTINLQNVDSVSIQVYTGEYDEIGRPITRPVRNVIQHLTGELRIDKPDNKSGRKRNDAYPMFASRENSYVYYQSKDIENGVYPEESFYFELYPFEIDSLDNFTKAGMNFRGKFQSSGILPPIEQNLILQPDLSLGFRHNPGPGGIPVYGGKGTLYADIQLSNKGLRANGKLKYVTSTTLSKDFRFYPDSMNTLSDQFTVNRQLSEPQYPKVTASGNYIHWRTGIFNRMYINQGNEPFNMFNNQTFLGGKLELDPKILTGRGIMNLTTAELHSRLYKYKAEIIDADTAKFLLKSLKKEGYTVLTEENVKTHIDFSIQKGEFIANDDYTKVEFPENKYISYLDYFKWNMDDKTLAMSALRSTSTEAKRTDKAKFEERFRHEEETEGPRYISTHFKQDSLNFVAPTAIYDYQANIIHASDVKLIRVADAIVYPFEGKVSVFEDAQMKTLNNAKLVANDLNKYHTIHSAELNIFGRKSLTGKGKYDYLDENEKVQVLSMNEIEIDKEIHTIAKSTVLEQDSFTLSPYFGYQGKIILNSTKPLLFFDGGTKILANCDKPKINWLKFESEIDPKNILIPVSEEPVNINNNHIYSGIMIAPDSIHIYPAFLSGRRGYNDKAVTTSSGFLRYNKDSMVYEIASLERFNYPDSVGNYLNLHHSKCIEYGEGKIDLGVDFGQLKVSAYGNARMDIPAKSVNLDIVLNLDFFFEPNALNIMATRIDSFPNLDTLNINRPVLQKSLHFALGKKASETYRDEVLAFRKPKIFPTALEHSISLTSLRLQWDDATNTYYSVGKIGVGSIQKYQVNKMVDGFVQIVKKRSGDVMDIYLKLDDKNYFYFGYTRSVLQAYSTNQPFLDILRALPARARQGSTEKGLIPYIFVVSTDSRIGNFMREYNRRMKLLKGEQPTDDQIPEAPEETPEEILQNQKIEDILPQDNPKPDEIVPEVKEDKK